MTATVTLRYPSIELETRPNVNMTATVTLRYPSIELETRPNVNMTGTGSYPVVIDMWKGSEFMWEKNKASGMRSQQRVRAHAARVSALRFNFCTVECSSHPPTGRWVEMFAHFRRRQIPYKHIGLFVILRFVYLALMLPLSFSISPRSALGLTRGAVYNHAALKPLLVSPDDFWWHLSAVPQQQPVSKLIDFRANSLLKQICVG